MHVGLSRPEKGGLEEHPEKRVVQVGLRPISHNQSEVLRGGFLNADSDVFYFYDIESTLSFLFLLYMTYLKSFFRHSN